jgi:hypothetical protein
VAHEMSTNQAHASRAVPVGARSTDGTRVAAIAHGVRNPIGPASLPDVLHPQGGGAAAPSGFQGTHAHAGAAVAVEECVCVTAMREAVGVLGPDEGASFGRLLEAACSQLYMASVGAGGASVGPPLDRRLPEGEAAAGSGREGVAKWGSVESLVQAVLVARHTLGRRVVVVLDGLVFNEAVYLASRLALLCQRGPEIGGSGGTQGILCRKAFFLLSTKPPGIIACPTVLLRSLTPVLPHPVPPSLHGSHHTLHASVPPSIALTPPVGHGTSRLLDPRCLTPRSHTLSPQIYTLNPQPSTLNSKPARRAMSRKAARACSCPCPLLVPPIRTAAFLDATPAVFLSFPVLPLAFPPNHPPPLRTCTRDDYRARRASRGAHAARTRARRRCCRREGGVGGGGRGTSACARYRLGRRGAGERGPALHRSHAPGMLHQSRGVPSGNDRSRGGGRRDDRSSEAGARGRGEGVRRCGPGGCGAPARIGCWLADALGLVPAAAARAGWCFEAVDRCQQILRPAPAPTRTSARSPALFAPPAYRSCCTVLI